MSFRVYPKFVKGNPQLRIFLPNFYMKLVKPAEKEPGNLVNFVVPIEMTDYDIKAYLEKIYKVPVLQVRSRIVTGDLRKAAPHKSYLVKDPDYRMARVTLPEDMKFEFPDIFPQEKVDKIDKEQKRLMDQSRDLMKQRRTNWERKDVPAWFSI